MKQSVFNYSDYRTFLNDHANGQKQRDPEWSYGRWAKRLNVANTAVISNILNGVRHPGPRIVEQLVQYFRFDRKETEYFKNLVHLSKKKQDPELVHLILEKLQATHPDQTFQLIEDRVFQVIAFPHYYALREMVNLVGFTEDTDWIAQRLRIKTTKPEIKRALRNLEELGLLTRDSSGKLKYHSGSMRSSHDISSEALRRFHEEMLSLAHKTIREVSVNERDITGITFSARKEDLPKIKDDIAKFRRSLMKKYEQLGGGDIVYQLNIQFFPLTEQPAKKEGDTHA